MTSSACVPMLPVEPRIATRFRFDMRPHFGAPAALPGETRSERNFSRGRQESPPEAPRVRNVRLALARRGELANAEQALAKRREMLRERGLPDGDPARAGLTTAELLAWYTARIGMTQAEQTDQHAIEALAARLGLKPRTMLEEILRCYLENLVQFGRQ